MFFTLNKIHIIHHFRSVKNNNKFFGGIQVITAGSFKQLPPVPSYSDIGEFCFESNIFSYIFPHHHFLNEVIRQQDVTLIKAIDELCSGNPSQETLAFMKMLQKSLPQGIQDVATYIFAEILMSTSSIMKSF